MIKKILVGVDGSSTSLKALEWGVELANKWSARLFILSVIPPLTPLVYMGSAPMYLEGYENTSRRSKEQLMEETTNYVIKKYPDLFFETRIVKGKPFEVINNLVEDEDVDLIILGSKGMGGFAEKILGSTSTKVVNSCVKPVLIIK